MAYDKAKVDRWLADVASSPGVAWAVFAGFNPVNLDIGEVMARHAEFVAMPPWEQVNALYGLRDLVEAEVKKVQAELSACARREDDKQ